MPRGKALKNPNGYGSVVKLSGKRRKSFEVRVNTRMDERYYPVYDVLGRFPTREEALIALADYNKNPYSISDREITFSQLYEKFYKNKYELSGKTYSRSSMDCTRSAYRHCEALYSLAYRKDKGYASFAAITVPEDDIPGIPFTPAELQILWDNKDVP